MEEGRDTKKDSRKGKGKMKKRKDEEFRKQVNMNAGSTEASSF